MPNPSVYIIELEMHPFGEPIKSSVPFRSMLVTRIPSPNTRTSRSNEVTSVTCWDTFDLNENKRNAGTLSACLWSNPSIASMFSFIKFFYLIDWLSKTCRCIVSIFSIFESDILTFGLLQASSSVLWNCTVICYCVRQRYTMVFPKGV